MSFKGKRLWWPLKVGSKVVEALIDTGAATSVLPRKLVRGETIVDEWNVITPLGSRMEPIVAPVGIELNGLDLTGSKFVASKSRFPIIGNNILLANGGVLLGRKGLRLGSDFALPQASATKEATITFGGSGASLSVERIAVSLLIDGTEQEAFIDTGRRTTLAATASAPLPAGSPAKGFEVRLNAFGQFKPTTYLKRKASIVIGEREIELPYRQFVSDKAAPEPFVVGGGILESFDLHVSLQDKVVSFFDSGNAFID